MVRSPPDARPEPRRRRRFGIVGGRYCSARDGSRGRRRAYPWGPQQTRTEEAVRCLSSPSRRSGCRSSISPRSSATRSCDRFPKSASRRSTLPPSSDRGSSCPRAIRRFDWRSIDLTGALAGAAAIARLGRPIARRSRWPLVAGAVIVVGATAALIASPARPRACRADDPRRPGKDRRAGAIDRAARRGCRRRLVARGGCRGAAGDDGPRCRRRGRTQRAGRRHRDGAVRGPDRDPARIGPRADDRADRRRRARYTGCLATRASQALARPSHDAGPRPGTFEGVH